MIVGKSLFPLGPAFASINNMQNRMETLQVQLATGKRAHSLSELGGDRTIDMTIRARQGCIEAFQSNIQMVNLRLDFLSNALVRLDEVEADSRGAVASGGIGDGFSMVNAQTLANGRLDEVITLLNSEVNGRYLLGGGLTDAPPVASLSAILDGEGGRDGFRTIVGERKATDAGADGRGRLTIATMPATTSSVFGGAVDGSELLSDAEIGFADTETFTLSGGGFGAVSISFTNVGGATTGPVLDINSADVNALVAEINSQAGATIASVNGGEIVIVGQDLVNPIVIGGASATGTVDSKPGVDRGALAEGGIDAFGDKMGSGSGRSGAVSATPPTATPTAP